MQTQRFDKERYPTTYQAPEIKCGQTARRERRAKQKRK